MSYGGTPGSRPSLCKNTATLFDSKLWEPTDSKNISKDEPLLLMSYTVEVESMFNKTVQKSDCKSFQEGKDNTSGVGSSTKSVVTCHKCGKNGHLKGIFKSNRNGSYGQLSKKSTRKLPKWVTKKPVIPDVENLTTATMNRNKSQYKWCTYFNDGNGVWGYHWKVDNREWKEKQTKNKSVHFSDPSTNVVVYCSYIMATNDKYVKEYSEDGDNSQEFV